MSEYVVTIPDQVLSPGQPAEAALVRESHAASGPLKRVAIIGTAQSWKECPWGDQGLEIWGLNDAYMIGVPRATRWYELHPFHQMSFREATAKASSGPMAESEPGVYVRPAQHLEWLKTRTFPIFLNESRPDYQTSQTFPRQAVLDHFARYWPWRASAEHVVRPGPDYEVSTPAWMLMHAIAEGYAEIHVYGIHLATQWEYVEQRPNFEFLLGVAAGMGVRVVLPDATPICRAQYRYAFEPKADIPLQACQQTINRIKQEGLRLRQQLARLSWYDAREKRHVEARLTCLDAELADARHTLQRLQMILAAA